MVNANSTRCPHTLERLPRGRRCIFMCTQMDVWLREADLLSGGSSGVPRSRFKNRRWWRDLRQTGGRFCFRNPTDSVAIGGSDWTGVAAFSCCQLALVEQLNLVFTLPTCGGAASRITPCVTRRRQDKISLVVWRTLFYVHLSRCTSLGI